MRDVAPALLRAVRPAAGAPAYIEPPAWWIGALALFAALVLQTTIEPLLPIRNATISFTLLVVVWYSLRAGTARGLMLGTVAGVCEDALAGGTGAAWTFATMVTALACGRAHGTFVAESRLWVIPLVIAATAARDLAFAGVMQMQGTPLALPLAHAHAFAWQAVLNGLGALVLLTWKPGLVVPDPADY